MVMPYYLLLPVVNGLDFQDFFLLIFAAPNTILIFQEMWVPTLPATCISAPTLEVSLYGTLPRDVVN